MATLVALVLVGVLAHARLTPPIAVWFMTLLLVRALGLLGPYNLRVGATRLGVAAAMVGGVGMIVMAVSWPR
jgi:hypothetical protein